MTVMSNDNCIKLNLLFQYYQPGDVSGGHGRYRSPAAAAGGGADYGGGSAAAVSAAAVPPYTSGGSYYSTVGVPQGQHYGVTTHQVWGNFYLLKNFIVNC